MIYNLYTDQQLALKLNLKAEPAMLMHPFKKLSNWATKETIDGDDYYYLGIDKLLKEVPMVCTSKDKAYRLIKILIEKKLIIRKEYKNNSYYRLTELGMTWGTRTETDIAKIQDSDAKQEDSDVEQQEEESKTATESTAKVQDNNNTNHTTTNTKDISIESFFNEFWEMYPKKHGKKLALKKFRQRNLHKKLPQILQALRNYNQTQNVDNGYILDPTKFIDIYEDYIQGIPEGVKATTTKQKKSPNEGGEANLLVKKLKMIFKMANSTENPVQILSRDLSTIQTAEQEQYFTEIEKATITEADGLVALERVHLDDGFKIEITETYEYIKNSQNEVTA